MAHPPALAGGADEPAPPVAAPPPLIDAVAILTMQQTIAKLAQEVTALRQDKENHAPAPGDGVDVSEPKKFCVQLAKKLVKDRVITCDRGECWLLVEI